jgi:cyclic pyranopterin phosphate synthase
LLLTSIAIEFYPHPGEGRIEIEATVKLTGQTGVEMEALTAVSGAALTIYDMCKAVDKAMIVSEIRLMEKHGGKSGSFIRRD